MLAVAEINYIRHEVNIKDSNYSEVAQRIGRDPRTVKKYAEQDDFSPEVKIKQVSVNAKIKWTVIAKILFTLSPNLNNIPIN